MVESQPQQAETRVGDLLQNPLKLSEFKCFSDETHTQGKDSIVINKSSGKLSCKKCLIQKGQSSEIVAVNRLSSYVSLDLQDVLEQIDTATETI